MSWSRTIDLISPCRARDLAIRSSTLRGGTNLCSSSVLDDRLTNAKPSSKVASLSFCIA